MGLLEHGCGQILWATIMLYIYIHFVLCISDEWPTLETLDFTIHIRSTPTFLYFDLYLLTLLVQSVSEVYIVPPFSCMNLGLLHSLIPY